MLGKLDIDDPDQLSKDLEVLRADLLADPYFKNVPSMQPENRKTNDVTSSTPQHSGGLQAVDYYLWALQRFYQRREERFLEMIWTQVGEVHDLDFVEDGRRGVFYTKRKPLNLAAFEKK